MPLRFTEDWLERKYPAKSIKKNTATVGEVRSINKKIGKQKKSINHENAESNKKSPHLIALNALARNPDLEKSKGEHYSQVRFFYYFEVNFPLIYRLLHATPNGGFRTMTTGVAMRAEGQKKGYPDISLDKAMQGFNGLRIELKHGNNKLTVDQKKWRDLLVAEGYKYVECRSTSEAINAVLDYTNNQEFLE